VVPLVDAHVDQVPRLAEAVGARREPGREGRREPVNLAGDVANIAFRLSCEALEAALPTSARRPRRPPALRQSGGSSRAR
jgi:hypothetical protein